MHKFQGIHILLDLYSIDSSKLNSIKAIEEAIRHGIARSGAHIVDIYVHKYIPTGVSIVIVLEESHVSIHTYPEHNSAFADIFTCGACNPYMIEEAICQYFGCLIENRIVIPRGNKLQKYSPK